MLVFLRGCSQPPFLNVSLSSPPERNVPRATITMRLAIAALAASLAAATNTLAPRDKAADATVETYPLFGCNNETMLGGPKTWSMPPDHCLKVSTSTSFKILEPAVCPNGTQAKLARYEGRDCNYGEVTIPGGLVEVSDDDLDVCQEVGIEGFSSNATYASIASFGWFCDGRKGDRPDEKDEPKEKWGSVSLNTCPRGRDPPRAPTWDHPLPGQCSAILTSERLDIVFPATCSDGSEAKLATWHGNRMCEGEYDEIQEITDDMMKECFFVDREVHSSFAFWCPDTDRGDGMAARPSVGLLSVIAAAWLFTGL